ncbi:hypothetical protein PT974_08146 [Cladobotryum mycophilum]|uniref:Uncharacterized protein n=1 Tax=Cladobotryum mycophilum TaxID=491253 RepID=A0ABR0SD41_9HYPO
MIPRGASSSVFMLLGGVASLPGATLVRGLLTKPKLSRRIDLEAEWDYQYFRSYGIALPKGESDGSAAVQLGEKCGVLDRRSHKGWTLGVNRRLVYAVAWEWMHLGFLRINVL